MGIVQYPQKLVGQEGVISAAKYMVTTDNLSTLETAGYLNIIDLAVFPIFPDDVIGVTWNYNLQTRVGTFGWFTVTIVNGVITLVESVPAGGVLLTGSTPTTGHLASFSGANSIQDSGVALAAVQLSANIKANSAAWAGGATSHAFTITGLTTSSIVIPSIHAQATGTVYIESYTVTANTLTVTFSADPGAMILQYVAFIAPQ